MTLTMDSHLRGNEVLGVAYIAYTMTQVVDQIVLIEERCLEFCPIYFTTSIKG